MPTIALIQARMGSTRLPGKVLMNILGLPVLQHVVQRVQKSQQVDEAIVVTSTHIQDQPIVDWCTNHGVRVFCGSEDDVLDRFYQTSKLIRANALVRITADCPLMDPQVIDQVVNLFKSQNVDYANNCENETWPDGLDVEVFKPEALEKAWKQTQVKSDREHVTPYIRKNTLLFSRAILDYSPSLKGMRWTLDQPEDFAFISKIYHELYIKKPFFGMKDVLTLLEEQPSLSTLNNGITRNEGYLKSLSQDIPHE